MDHTELPSVNDSQIAPTVDDTLEKLDPEGFNGPSGSEKVVKPLTPEALADFNATVEKSGVIYISRIPPGMSPPKVRHLMSAHGEVGRVYLKQEDAKRAYLRKKFTSTKKPHFVEGWVEFRDKRIARTVAEMLNAQPIGGKKGTRWRDDIWTIKYLPKFKWNMLTEQIAHEAAAHTARLRTELIHSRAEQNDYLRKVELARVLDKRSKKKRKNEEKEGDASSTKSQKFQHIRTDTDEKRSPKRSKQHKYEGDFEVDNGQLKEVLGNIF